MRKKEELLQVEEVVLCWRNEPCLFCPGPVLRWESERVDLKKEGEEEIHVYHRIVLREEDCFLYILSPTMCRRMVELQKQHTSTVAFIQGTTLGLCLSLWSGLVLTRIIPAGFSLLFAIVGLVIIVWKMSLKSHLITTHLRYRMSFLLDMALFLVMDAFLGISLGWTMETIPMLVFLIFLYFDWRLGDAHVCPKESSNVHHPWFFFPLVVGILSIPILVYVGQIPDVSLEVFVLVPFANGSNAADYFVFENPPSGSLSRLRYSQIVFDAILVFATKLIIDGLQRAMIFIHNPDTILLDQIVQYVTPKAKRYESEVDLDAPIILELDSISIVHNNISQISSTPPRKRKHDPFWDVDPAVMAPSRRGSKEPSKANSSLTKEEDSPMQSPRFKKTLKMEVGTVLPIME